MTDVWRVVLPNHSISVVPPTAITPVPATPVLLFMREGNFTFSLGLRKLFILRQTDYKYLLQIGKRATEWKRG